MKIQLHSVLKMRKVDHLFTWKSTRFDNVASFSTYINFPFLRLPSIWREFCALQKIFIITRFVVINSIKVLSFVYLVIVQEREMVTTSLMWVHVPRHWSGSPKIPRKFWLPKREARFLKRSAASWEMDICACTRTWTWPCTNKSRETHVHVLEHSPYHVHRTWREPNLVMYTKCLYIRRRCVVNCTPILKA